MLLLICSWGGVESQCCHSSVFITGRDQTPEEMGTRAEGSKKGRKYQKPRFLFQSFTSSHTYMIFLLEENTPGRKGSPNVSLCWLPSQEAASLPWLSQSERTATTPPLREANLIIKLCKVWTVAFVSDLMTHSWNYAKRSLKIKGAKDTMRSHKQLSSGSMGNWLQESCGAKTTHAPASSIKRYGIWR